MESLYSDYSQATKYHITGDYHKAIDEWMKLAKYVKKNPNLYYLLGLDCMHIGMNEFAITCFEEAINLDSNNRSYHEALADAQKKIDQAKTEKKVPVTSFQGQGRALAA